MPGTPYLNWTNIPTLPKLAAFEKFFKTLKKQQRGVADDTDGNSKTATFSAPAFGQS